MTSPVLFQKADVKTVILIYNLSCINKVRNLTFFGIFDLRWPFITSLHALSESWWQKRLFYIRLAHFQWLLKFDLFSEFLTSDDLCWPRDPFFWKADAKSVILIYNLPTFNEFWNLTLNDPKFVIWLLTQIFSSGNNSQVLLIILSYRTLSLIKSVIY